MKKIYSLVLLVVFSFLLSACDLVQTRQPPKQPLEMLKSATDNTRKILSSRNDGVFDLSVATKEEGEAKNFQGHANLKLAVDMNNAKSAAFQIDLDGSFQQNSKNDPLVFSVRAMADNEAIYLKLEKLTGLESELSAEIQRGLIGQWWKIPLEPQILERFVNDLKNAKNLQNSGVGGSPQGGSPQGGSPQGESPQGGSPQGGSPQIFGQSASDRQLSQQILTWQNLFSNPANIQNVSYQGTVSGKAGESYRYIFEPGKPFFDALKVSLRGGAGNLPIPSADLPSDLKDMDAFFDALKAKAEMWVLADREITSKIVLDLKADDVKDSKGLQSDLIFHMDLESYDFGTKLVLEKPAEVKVFDPKAFLSGMAAGAGAGAGAASGVGGAGADTPRLPDLPS